MEQKTIQKKDNKPVTFESLALAGLSVGLSMNEILELPLNLTMSMINEKNNQIDEARKKEKPKEQVTVGNADLLKSI